MGAVLVMAGCSFPGLPGATGAPDPIRAVAASPAAAPEPGSAGETARPPEPASPEPGWAPLPGDLSSGSVTHRLGAADHTLVIDYWTTETVADWTPDSAPIINFTARIDSPSSGRAIVVTRCNVRVDALAAVLSNDTGSFAIEPPYAYSSAVVVPANPTAAGTKVVFTLDLLTETEPDSGIFTRQTVIDALTIGYPKPGAAALAVPAEPERQP